MVECGVDDRIGVGGTGANAVQILERAEMRLGACRREHFRSAFRSRQAAYLMPRGEEFGQDPRSDEARRTCKENTHE